MPTYGDKLAELRATAEGGAAGRTAYREGRQRLISDQRAAIDAALAGPVRFGAGTAEALDNIVAPVGTAAAARMDFAGERHDESLGALDAALGSALSQQAGARQLNYDTTLGDMRTATDRSMTLAEIQRRKAEEAAAARASEQDAYTAAEQKAIAEFLGGAAHDEDLAALQAQQRQQASNDLLGVAREAFSMLPDKQQAGLIMQIRQMADDPAGIAALIAKYSPAHRRQAETVASRVGDALANTAASVLNTASSGSANPTALPGAAPRPVADPDRAAAIERLLSGYAELPARQAQDYRAAELDRYLYNRDAYASLFGDPLLAAGLYPQSFDPVKDAVGVDEAFDQYRDTGLVGNDYERAVASQFQSQIAQAAGVLPGVVSSVANSTLGKGNDTALFETLADPDVAAVVSRAVEDAVATFGADPEDGSDGPSKSDVTKAIVVYMQENLPDYVAPEYRAALSAVARRQFESVYGG